MGVSIKKYHEEDFIEFDDNEFVNLVFKVKGGVETCTITPNTLLRVIKNSGDGNPVIIKDERTQKSS
ncbi:hypothetical protein BDD43_3301 [Mucilaginibacter gracilis]|uniref:Uncharacterized protein n=1 Tax=Mucilaginibacter gracilis TaxID=423350 RepID=A0A495J2A6_9SPHI|nr:hypothetical protein [Mucilaginibacter gracilis]RKR83100.1 hypothetical protein BDD43_3301 [Mucilaginibacter gracilis]